MVPIRLENRAVRRAARSACFCCALSWACARPETGGAAARVVDSAGASDVPAIAQAVRARYGSTDAEAAGAWSWTAPSGRVFVLVDVQSLVPGVVQGRADLWIRGDSGVVKVGQSDLMSTAADIGAYAFEDLTGDSLPDLFGYVADSAGERYPVFIPGALGALSEEIANAAPGWRFLTDDDHMPQVVRSGAAACALQLWAAEGAPDNKPEGWRWLSIFRGRIAPGGRLGAPQAAAPSCGP